MIGAFGRDGAEESPVRVLASLTCSPNCRRRSCPTCSPSPTTCGHRPAGRSRPQVAVRPWDHRLLPVKPALPATATVRRAAAAHPPAGARAGPVAVRAGPSWPAAGLRDAGHGVQHGALSVGVPLVVAPLAADQPICAMGCVLAGAAESLDPSRHRSSSWPTRSTPPPSRPPRSARRPYVCWRHHLPPGRTADRR